MMALQIDEVGSNCGIQGSSVWKYTSGLSPAFTPFSSYLGKKISGGKVWGYGSSQQKDHTSGVGSSTKFWLQIAGLSELGKIQVN